MCNAMETCSTCNMYMLHGHAQECNCTTSDYDQHDVIAFRPISVVACSWSYDTKNCQSYYRSFKKISNHLTLTAPTANSIDCLPALLLLQLWHAEHYKCHCYCYNITPWSCSGNTVEENSSIFCLFRMCKLPPAKASNKMLQFLVGGASYCRLMAVKWY